MDIFKRPHWKTLWEKMTTCLVCCFVDISVTKDQSSVILPGYSKSGHMFLLVFLCYSDYIQKLYKKQASKQSYMVLWGKLWTIRRCKLRWCRMGSTTTITWISPILMLTLKVLVATIDAQWEGMGDVGSARYKPALLPPCPTIRVLRYSN